MNVDSNMILCVAIETTIKRHADKKDSTATLSPITIVPKKCHM